MTVRPPRVPRLAATESESQHPWCLARRLPVVRTGPVRPHEVTAADLGHQMGRFHPLRALPREKQQAAPMSKRSCGQGGSNTAADHIRVLDVV